MNERVINMALIQCPECMKEVSESAEICIHCGYPIKKSLQKQRINESTKNIDNSNKNGIKGKRVLLIALVFIVVILGISMISHSAKQAEIEKYRVEFTSEDDMRNMLRSGNWWLTSFGGGYSIGGYVSFEHSFFNYYEENNSDTPLRTQYKLDYKNSSILTTDGSFYYDVIYYKNDYYLRQNPKVEKENWILFRLSEYYN